MDEEPKTVQKRLRDAGAHSAPSLDSRKKECSVSPDAVRLSSAHSSAMAVRRRCPAARRKFYLTSSLFVHRDSWAGKVDKVKKLTPTLTSATMRAARHEKWP